MVKIKEPNFKIKKEEEKKDYGRFIIEPLEQGYGHTVGNALRRCLLSSLPGAAITRIKINGVAHPFSTIKGVKEDVVEVILNLKQVRVDYDKEKEFKLTLNAKGKGAVKAGDIKTSEGIEIINKDLKLATLASKNSKLKMNLWINSGFGYSPSEERKTDTVGIIPLDAVFTPIVKVNYKVEATRVGRRTDFDKLIFEIWTDGTITSREALEKSAKILASYFEPFYVVEKKEEEEEKREEVKEKENKALKLDIEDLGLSTRVKNALKRAGYEKVEDLVKAGKEEIHNVRSIGDKSVKSIAKKLEKKGIELKK